MRRSVADALSVRVADAMRPGALGTHSGASVAAMAAVMAANDVHAVVVDGEPRALVTDLDVVAAAVAGDAIVPTEGRGLAEIDPASTLYDAARRMAAEDVRHLAVRRTGDVLPAGMLSTLDVAAALAGRDPRMARVLRPHPSRPAVSESRLDHLLVRDLMHHGVIACGPDSSLAEVAGMLVDRRVHCVSVAGLRPEQTAEHLVWGIVSDADVVAAAAAGASPRASELAGTEPVAISCDERVSDAARLMVDHGVTHVVAVGAGGAPVGVLSTLDVIGAVAVAAYGEPAAVV